MDLYALDSNLKGRGIYVNGKTYKVDAEGIARGVSDVDAKKLLTMPSWSATPASGTKRAAAKAKIQLLDSSGRAVQLPAPPAIPPTPPAAEPEPSDFPTMTPEAEESPEVPLTGEVDEWPEPSLDMTKAMLHEMAKAYDVEFDPKKTTKQELVDTIHSARYG